MIIQIEAIDTLFFRDGKPFNMGDDTWASGIFPPLPSVFYGALRTAYFSQYPEKLTLANTDGDLTKQLKIRGIYLYKEGNIFFPVFSEFVTSNEEEIFFQRNNLKETEEIFSNAKTVLNPYENKIEGVQGLLDIFNHRALENFIYDTQIDLSEYKHLDALIKKEPKIGIGRQNATKTTEEGKLYRVSLNRMEIKGSPNKKLSFLVDVNTEVLGQDFKPRFLKLGGENKLAEYKPMEIEIDLPRPTIQKCFKLALLTPTIFEKTTEGRKEGGWLPDCFVYDEVINRYVGTWKNVKLKLLRAFIGGSVAVGGFDTKQKQPKDMYKAVVAGSVYHFEILDNTDSNTIYSIFGNSDEPLSDILTEQGFGLSLVGFLNN